MSVNIKRIIYVIAILSITITFIGCTKSAAARFYIPQVASATKGVVYGSELWVNEMDRLCPDANWELKECHDAQLIKKERAAEDRRIKERAGYKTPEQLAEQKREWDNVQKWFGFYNLTEGLNRQLSGSGSYNNQKQANRKQDSRRGKCLAQCNSGGGGSIQRFNSCQTYCYSVFPEL